VRGLYVADITFNDPSDRVEYTCRLDDDELELVENKPLRWAATIRLLEVSNFKAFKPAVTAFSSLASGAVVRLPYRMKRRYRTVVETQEGTPNRMGTLCAPSAETEARGGNRNNSCARRRDAAYQTS
jgi:hypothetical protein